jgi:predicted secreted protein
MKTMIAVCSGFLFACGVSAQVLPPPHNVLQLAAEGTVEVQQDLLTITMSTTREGADANTVQAQLKAAIDSALAEARKSAQPQEMEVRTGNFSLAPRYTQGGRIGSWQGTAELLLEGRDFTRITQTAGRIQALTVGAVGFGLSREQRLKVEKEAQMLAIEQFKSKAAELTKGFGFTGYSLREVAVNSNDASPVPRMRMQASVMRPASAEAAVPVEAGKSMVTVNVSGSVQLH